MKILRKVLSAIFVVLALLSLMALLVQGFQLIQMASISGWLITAVALNGVGGKPMRIIGYITGSVIVAVFAMFLQMTMTLEPGSHDAFGAFVVSSAGMLLGGLAIWGIYSTTKEEAVDDSQPEL